MNYIIENREKYFSSTYNKIPNKYKKDFDNEFLIYLTNRFNKYWVFEEFEISNEIKESLRLYCSGVGIKAIQGIYGKKINIILKDYISGIPSPSYNWLIKKFTLLEKEHNEQEKFFNLYSRNIVKKNVAKNTRESFYEIYKDGFTKSFINRIVNFLTKKVHKKLKMKQRIGQSKIKILF